MSKRLASEAEMPEEQSNKRAVIDLTEDSPVAAARAPGTLVDLTGDDDASSVSTVEDDSSSEASETEEDDSEMSSESSDASDSSAAVLDASFDEHSLSSDDFHEFLSVFLDQMLETFAFTCNEVLSGICDKFEGEEAQTKARAILGVVDDEDDFPCRAACGAPGCEEMDSFLSHEEITTYLNNIMEVLCDKLESYQSAQELIDFLTDVAEGIDNQKLGKKIAKLFRLPLSVSKLRDVDSDSDEEDDDGIIETDFLNHGLTEAEFGTFLDALVEQVHEVYDTADETGDDVLLEITDAFLSWDDTVKSAVLLGVAHYKDIDHEDGADGIDTSLSNEEIGDFLVKIRNTIGDKMEAHRSSEDLKAFMTVVARKIPDAQVGRKVARAFKLPQNF